MADKPVTIIKHITILQMLFFTFIYTPLALAAESPVRSSELINKPDNRLIQTLKMEFFRR